MKSSRFIFHTIRRLTALLLAVTMLFVVLPSFAPLAASDNNDEELPWLWPVPGSYRLNSLDYYFSGGLHNQGQCIDIDSNGYYGSERLDIVSATNGTVFYIRSGYNETTNKGSGWGNYVIVRTGDIYIVYGHLKSISCTYGEIKAGDVIGKMGNTGDSTGVHLHLQAYPVNSNIYNTSIRVFEQYRNNPMYIEKFQFLKGLRTYSVAYRDWIAAYYQNSNGVYYSYSGGLSLDIPTVSTAATVTVINTSGAPIRSSPCSDNALITDTFENGTVTMVHGYYVDAYGAYWLSVKDEAENIGWIRATDVGFNDYCFDTVITDPIYPEGEYGGLVELPFGGTLSSSHRIDSYVATILKDGETVARYQHSVNAPSYVIGEEILSGFSLETLGNGTYTYQLSVLETASFPGIDSLTKEHVLLNTTFHINSEISDQEPPVLSSLEILSQTDKVILFECKATDNKRLQKISMILSFSDNSFSKTYTFALENDSYRLSVPTAELNGSGLYRAEAVVYDGYGNTDTASVSFTLSPETSGEIWQVNTSTPLRIRSGPGTEYTQLGLLYNGTRITVTEIQDAGGYTWGHYSNGWVALDFCERIEGTLNTISFDLNGGTSSTIASLHKNHDETISLPSDVPTREGYEFVGWAYRSLATQADYLPGSDYSANASVTLFAVWADAVPPTIESISVSTTTWTNQPVTITVIASDNTNTVFYTFDGGKTWTENGTFTVQTNMVFELGEIAVKDAFGTVVSIDEVLTISNIDTDTPDLSQTTLSPIIEEGSVLFSPDGVLESGSGIASQVVLLSQTRDFASVIRVDCSTSASIQLEDGVYYLKLQVTDLAGNSTEKEFSRFRVGAVTPLPTVTGVTVKRTTATTAELSWTPIQDADAYRVLVSLTPDFTDPIIVDTTDSSAIVPGLNAAITYYVTVTASVVDEMYLDSPPASTVEFVTLNDDTAVYGMVAYEDAELDAEKKLLSYLVPYAVTTLDLSLILGHGATVTYFSNNALTQPIAEPSAYQFTDAAAEIHLQITAENGDLAVYRLQLTRAAQVAAAPIVTYEPKHETLAVGQENPTFSLVAISPDGGSISVVWYGSLDGEPPVKLGEDVSITPSFTTAGRYTVYAVITNTNSKCETVSTEVTTNPSSITIHKHKSDISVYAESYTFTGLAPSVTYSDYIGDGVVSYRFFSDEALSHEIQPPVNAGTYYVVAYATETDRYQTAISKPLAFMIHKAKNDKIPSVAVIQPALRDRKGYLTVTDTGLEYRIGNDAFLPLTAGTHTFSEGDIVEIRFAETDNYQAGGVTTVTIHPFSGTESILPKANAPLTVSDSQLFLRADELTVEMLLTMLEKTENVVLYDADGKRLSNTDLVRTGYIIAVEDNIGIFTSLTIILPGDLNQNGTVEESEVQRILALSNGTKLPSSALESQLADLNLDGVITIADAYLTLLLT